MYLCIIESVFLYGHDFRYYGLDAYYRRKMEKEMKKGYKKVKDTERTVFNDEEQRRYVLMIVALFLTPLVS